MRDFEDSTLWRISAFERVHRETGSSGFARLDGPTVLPTTLLTDLGRIDADPRRRDVLEVLAACIRNRESALLCVQHGELVWPLTVFPNDNLYHSPRDLQEASAAGLGSLKLLTVEPPGVRPPGHQAHERIAHAEHYRPLSPLLWKIALEGPRRTLLADIEGPAAYRLVATGSRERPVAPGALGSAVARLQRDSTTLDEIAQWPGMSRERASRLLNGVYLSGHLLVTRTRAVAREASAARGWFGRRR